MRFMAAAGLCCLLSSNAYALDAQSWQSQLQAEMNRIEQRSPMMKAQGQVTVQEQGANYIAVLPTMVITASDQSQWKVPSVSLIAPASSAATGKVTIQLPSAISYKEANGQERSTIAIGQQNISGTWNFAKNYFENLNGSLGNIAFTDKTTGTQSNVAQIALNAANAAQADITATDLKNSTTKDGKIYRGSVGKANVSYQFAGAPQLTITRVIGLLNPVWLLAENQNFGIKTNASQLSFTNEDGQVSTIANVTSNTQIQPKESGKILGATTQLELTQAAQTPDSVYGFILPKKLSMNATMANMPIQMLSFGPGQAAEIAKKAAAQAGMTATITDLTWDTYNKASLKGSGTLKAAENVPLGMTGRLTFNLHDLQSLITALQQQMNKPGADMAMKTKGIMILMILQGMGKQDSNVTQFVLDMTADGQVLLNGNNIAALLPGKNSDPTAGLTGALQGFMGGSAAPKPAGTGI